MHVGVRNLRLVLLTPRRPSYFRPSQISQSPELGLYSCSISEATKKPFDSELPSNYAADRCASGLPNSGSYSAPVTHSLWSSTPTLRATATRALLREFFPPRSHKCRPHRFNIQSGELFRSKRCAHSTNRDRRRPSPALVILSCGSRLPLWLCLGRNPKKLPTSRLFLKRPGSSIVSTYVSAVIGPTPCTAWSRIASGYRSDATVWISAFIASSC